MKNSLKLVNTSQRYFSVIAVFVFGALTAISYALFFTRGASESFMDAFNFPSWLKIVIVTIGIISFIAALWFVFLRDKEIGSLELNNVGPKIFIDNKELNFLKLSGIIIKLNPHPNKPIHYREITSFGGNNWLEIEEQNGEKHRYEFLIRSEKQEKEILELVEKWRENGLNVEVGKSRKMFWERFM
jgi:hypothetical protein